MYNTYTGERDFEIESKKGMDPEKSLVSWLMAEDDGASSPFEFQPTADDPHSRFSYETFPQQLPPFVQTPVNGFRTSPLVDGMYEVTSRPMGDTFGFPTELQVPSQGEPPFHLQDSLSSDPFHASTDNTSSNHRTARPPPPSAAQVKNRKAQKKFRERQKAKMVNLSEEVEALRRRVEDLSVANRDLGNSNMLLNKVMKMRDRQMTLIKARSESLMLEKNKEMTTKNGKLPPMLTCTDDEALSMERSLEVAKHLSSNFPASKFTDISRVSMRDIWKSHVDELSVLLLDHESDPDNPDLLEKISITVGELGEVCMKCATLCPTSMCALVATGDTAIQHPADSQEVQTFWTNVLTSLKMSEHQERLLLDLRSRFMHHLETVWKKRTLLSNRLQSFVMAKEDVFKSNMYSCRSGSGVREIFEQLQETCLTDGQYHTDFIASFFQLVLNDLQTARVFVESFPYYPDVLQISNLVFKKHQNMGVVSTKASPSPHETTGASVLSAAVNHS